MHKREFLSTLFLPYLPVSILNFNFIIEALYLVKLGQCSGQDKFGVGQISSCRLKPRLHKAIADKSVVFLTKAGMEPTKTDLARMVTYSHSIKSYLGKDEFHR